MFQKSLLKNFVKSFNTPNFNDIINLVTKNKFISLLSSSNEIGIINEK